MAFKLNSPDNQGDDGDIMADINMTPLIDIMLVLLIIFMVTSSVSLDSGLDIDLPKTKEVANKSEDKTIVVSLDKEQRLYVNGQVVAKDQLEGAIHDALTKEGAGLVVFQGDTQSPLGDALEIMEMAKRAGAEKFAIASEQQIQK